MPEFLRNFGIARLGAMAGMTAALVGFFFYLSTEILTPPKSLLFSGLDPRDSAEIVARLEAQNVDYELKGDGTTILVPQDQALRLRMEMAGQGLPAGGSIGYEIFDNQDALGATSFLQNVNLVRALEGELARTIRSLSAVDQARVHLVIPKRELFARENRDPSASIVIRPRGQLNASQVQAIQNLVAAAVEGLTAGNVSIIDDKGQLLGGGMAGTGENAVQASLEERTSAYETRVRNQVEEIVTSVVGPGKARVQVSADLDFNRVTKESVTYDPEGQVVRSTSTTSSQANSSESEAQTAGVSVAGSLPGEQASSGEAGEPKSVNAKTSTDETVNYEISSERRTEVLEGGGVQRLSVAVVVDGAYTTAADGTRSYQPRSEEEMKQITALVRSAIGYDEKRGDRLEVVNMRFAEIEVEPLVPEEEPFLGLTSADLMRLVEVSVMGVISLLLILLVFRPLMNRLLSPPAGGLPALAGGVPGGEGQVALPNMPGAPALPGGQQMALPSGMSGGAPMAALPGPGGAPSMIDIARVHGQVKENSVKKVGEIIGAHPDEAMAIMRTWLHEAS